jgi:hypothetical protein
MAATKHSKTQSQRPTNRRTPDPKEGTTQAAPKSSVDSGSVDAFLEGMASTPEFKRLNPNVIWANGRFESVPVEPRKVVPLPDPGGKRREKAMTDASAHMLAISNALVVFAAMECGEVPPLENFDRACTSDIVKALAIRSRDLNSAMLAALVGDIDGSELKGLVRFGGSIS